MSPKSLQLEFEIDCEVKLKAALKAVKKGETPEDIRFSEPESHEDDYNAVIDMLEIIIVVL